jgi:ADP-ribose pyrophosphatase YjhB (NUDIX family)
LALVGGAVLIDEPLPDAVRRHVRATFGSEVDVVDGSLTFVGVYQYARAKNVPGTHDPSKNAVSLTYVGRIRGPVAARGEAQDLVRFALTDPPPDAAFGFGHHLVTRDCLAVALS